MLDSKCDDNDHVAFADTHPAASFATRATTKHLSIEATSGASTASRLKTRAQQTAAIGAVFVLVLLLVSIAVSGSSWTHGEEEGQRASRKPRLELQQQLHPRHQEQQGPPHQHQGLEHAAEPSSSSYCPWCSEDDRVLCARKFLFILATGRSGSTTLMATVNSIPGFFVSGENYNEPSRLRAMYAARVPRDCLSTDDDGASLNAPSSSSASSSSLSSPSSSSSAPSNRSTCLEARRRELAWIQAWLWESNLPPPGLPTGPPEVVGFKEIRWTAEDVQFIQQVAPCSRFILNMRKNATNQARSNFFRQQGSTTASLGMVRMANERTLNASQTIGPERLYALHLEDFSVDAFAKLSKWLGTPCVFDKITHANAKGSLVPRIVRPCRRIDDGDDERDDDRR